MKKLGLFIVLFCFFQLKDVKAAQGCLIGSETSGTLFTGSYTTSGFFGIQRTYTNNFPQSIICPSASASISHATNLD